MISESYRSDRVDGLPYSTLKAAAGPVKQKIGSPLRSPPIFPLTGWRNARLKPPDFGGLVRCGIRPRWSRSGIQNKGHQYMTISKHNDFMSNSTRRVYYDRLDQEFQQLRCLTSVFDVR